ncbi:MAG: alpha-xylosidase [Bacteroidales bacterium]|nr:alpha-xylosidase [Candidatus Liminaster caballi]
MFKTVKKTMATSAAALLLANIAMPAAAQMTINNGIPYLLSQTVDMSQQFMDPTNTYFSPDSLVSFDMSTGHGVIEWKRWQMHPRQAFNLNGYQPVPLRNLDFPGPAYDQSPRLEFAVEPVNERTLRVRVFTSPILPVDPEDDVMLVQKPACDFSAWAVEKTDKGYKYTSKEGSLEIVTCPWRLILRDANGNELTQSRVMSDNDSTQVKTQPFTFVKRGSDNSRSIEPVLSLAPGERIYGCGESAMPLNKAGQKLNLFVTDPQGPETPDMYKPIPFFFSNRGYGIFMHTSAPVTVDFGESYIGSTRLFMADEQADLFIMLGSPKEILGEYTSLVGRPDLPPLWSFGTWMSRISYFTEKEGRTVASKLRELRLPSDVIHFDTGWFEVDWQCDYKFSPKNFDDPEKMLKELKDQGFHTCLWQLPYFTPKNRYFHELYDENMCVKSPGGGLPYEDAVLDFSNPKTVKWYQDKLEGLLKQGVATIKCDFGEAAPLNNGLYASGRTGLYEHNLYPVRYNRAAYEVIKKTNNGEGIIWGRSAWAGSQRYPLHWGGDAATTNTGLLGTIREGLSFGLSGFSFWSHDIGGFVTKSPDELYRRWLPYGMLTSHSRVHGVETEPWLYDDDFVNYFRECAELKYKLMPYVYAQAKMSADNGLPMQRALLLEFPDDPGAWMIDDEYMFGEQILVAPMLESGTSRTVYLPGNGKWIDYQTGKKYQSGWHQIECGRLPIIIMVKDGSAIPHVQVAQNTGDIDWKKIDWKKYKVDEKKSKGYLFKPGDKEVETKTF